jgi:hypothetical protein
LNRYTFYPPAEMQACDRETTKRFGVASIDLMQAAVMA